MRFFGSSSSVVPSSVSILMPSPHALELVSMGRIEPHENAYKVCFKKGGDEYALTVVNLGRGSFDCMKYKDKSAHTVTEEERSLILKKLPPVILSSSNETETVCCGCFG